MHPGKALHTAACGRSPLSNSERSAWGGLAWHWTSRIGQPVVLDVARRVGRKHQFVRGNEMRLLIRDELVVEARRRKSRPPAVRRRAAADRAVKAALRFDQAVGICPKCGGDFVDGACPLCGSWRFAEPER